MEQQVSGSLQQKRLGGQVVTADTRDQTSSQMASSQTSLENDLTCMLCQEIYKEPVILLCSHSFCRVCLQENWGERGVRICPICGKRSFIQRPPVNQALESACESFVQERNSKLLAKSQGVLCFEHNEKVHLFCLDDHMPLCATCVSRQHRNHNFCSTSRAAFEFKVKWVLAVICIRMERQVNIPGGTKCFADFLEREWTVLLMGERED